jgi:hypothetical protein
VTNTLAYRNVVLLTTVKSLTVLALGVIVLTTKWLKPFSPELLMLFPILTCLAFALARATTFSIMTFSITTLSIMTFSITIN